MKALILLILVILMAASCNSHIPARVLFANKLEGLCYTSGEYCMAKWKYCYTHCVAGEAWLESGRWNASCQRYNALKMMPPDIETCEYMASRSYLETEQYYKKSR